MIKTLKKEKSLLILSILLLLPTPIGFLTLLLGTDGVGDEVRGNAVLITIVLLVLNYIPAFFLNVINKIVFRKSKETSFFKGTLAIWFPSAIIYILMGITHIIGITFDKIGII